MKYLLQVDFPHNGPFGNELTKIMTELAHDITKEEGLVWKIWTENETTKQAGGVYVFNNLSDTERYLKKHTERLEGFGYTNIIGKIFNINEELSSINNIKF